jgi:Spy/CpxP family protein refolding chaperone
MKTDKISLLLMAVLFGSFIASAQPQKMKDGKNRMMDQLELTENQQGQIESLRQKHHDQMIQTRSELKIREAELDAAILAEDRKAAQSLVSSINKLKGTAFSNKIQHQLDVKALLDEDQKRKFDQMILAKEPMGGRKGMHEGSPHPGHPRNRGKQGGRGGN